MEDVNGMFDSCFLVYCNLLGNFCSENIIFFKKLSSTEEASNDNVAKKS